MRLQWTMTEEMREFFDQVWAQILHCDLSSSARNETRSNGLFSIEKGYGSDVREMLGVEQILVAI